MAHLVSKALIKMGQQSLPIFYWGWYYRTLAE